jgi:hypothetical protein
VVQSYDLYQEVSEIYGYFFPCFGWYCFHHTNKCYVSGVHRIFLSFRYLKMPLWMWHGHCATTSTGPFICFGRLHWGMIWRSFLVYASAITITHNVFYFVCWLRDV